MSGQVLWGKWIVMTTLLTLGGYGLLKATTPTEEQWYQQLSPELKKKVDEVRAQRAKSTLQDKLEAASDDGKVVWGDELHKTKK